MKPFPIETVASDEQGWTVEVDVPADCPAFRGHFPEEPVLPAIAQFRLLEQVIGRCLETDVVMTGIPSIRLRRKIQADDRVVVRLDRLPEQPGAFRFSLAVKNVRTTSGVVEVRPS